MTAFPFLLFLLLAVALAAQAATLPDVRFVVQTSPLDGRMVAHVYTNARLHGLPLPIVFEGDRFNASALVITSGRRVMLANTLVPSGRSALDAALSLAAVGTNPLWARWRYAQWMNHSVLLTNAVRETMLATPPAPHAALRMQCALAPSAAASALFCDAGRYYEPRLQANFSVLVRPQMARGILPPALYFMLTNGRAALAGGSLSQEQRDLRALDTTRCLRFEATSGPAPARTFDLCDDDSAYFTLGHDNATLIIGGLFWRANLSLVALDGQTGALVGLYADGDAARLWIVQLLSAVAATLTVLVTYGRWTTGTQTPSIGLVLWHMLYQAVPRRALEWSVDMRFGLGTFLLGLSAVTATLFGWLGLPLGVDAFSASPNFLALAATLTAVGWAQFAVALGGFLWTDVRGGGCREGRWGEDHAVPVMLAWMRHQGHATSALAFATLAILPLAFDGIYADSRFLVVVLLPPFFALVYHQTYYTVAWFALGTRTWIAYVVYQLLVLGVLVGTGVYFLMGPLFAITGAYFDAAFDHLAAGFVMGAVIIMACSVVAWETTGTLARISAMPSLERLHRN